jgi:hypothetical protein
MPTTHPGASVDSGNAISTRPAIEIRSLASGDDATARLAGLTACTVMSAPLRAGASAKRKPPAVNEYIPRFSII